MKKIFITIVCIFLFLIMGAAVFIFTFDLNRFRPQIEKQATTALGQPVHIGNLSLAWRGGIAVEVDGVQVLSNDEPVLKIQRAGAVLQIAPLLRRSVQIGSLFLDGADIRVVKSKEGKIEIQGLQSFGADRPGQAEVSTDSLRKSNSGKSTQAAISSFLIGSVSLRDINVHYEDDTPDFPIQLDVRNFDLDIKNVSFFRPMEFQASAGLLSAKQNVHLSGRLKMTEGGADVSVDNFKGEIDLGQLDLRGLAKSLPRFMADTPISNLEGKVKVDVEHLAVKSGKLSQFEADLSLNDGKLSAMGVSPLVEQLQITVNRFRLNEPVDFKMKAAIFSKESDVSFQGKLQMSDAGRVSVGPAQFDFDLERLDWKKVEAFLPAIRSAGFAAPPEGRVHADIRQFTFEPNRAPAGEVDFRYDQGRLKLKSLPHDLNQINLTGSLRGDQLNLDVWNMNFGTSPSEGRINIQNIFTAPVFRTEMKARNLDLKNLIPPAPAGQPSMEGLLSVDFSMSGKGKVPDVILPSLAGSGHFTIENPIIRNLNVLDQILTKLSAIPGLNDAINQRTSDKLKSRLAKRDTNLNKIDQDFSLQNQTIRFESFEIVSDDLMVRGPLNARIDGFLESRPTIWIHEEIMAELVDRVKELAFALNPQGQLQIPLNITGKSPQINVVPDVQFLLGEIVRSRSNQVAGQLAQRVARGKGIGNLSQILGVKPYADAENTDPSAVSQPADQPIDAMTTERQDNAVPVRVHQSQQQKTQSLLDAFTGSSSPLGSKNQKAELAAGLLNAFLSSGNNSGQAQNSSQSGAGSSDQ